jgi:hypothetical protein
MQRLHGRAAVLAAAALATAAAAGCGEQRRVTKPGGTATASAPAPAPEEEIKLRPVINERTDDIKDAAAELQKGGQQANMTIVAKDPITLPGNAYVTIIGRASIDQITYALRLYEAENGRYPKDYQEFMDEVIKKNNIALPQLPFYQDYAYDEKEHKLVVLEYPDRKARFQAQQDKRFGRD